MLHDAAACHCCILPALPQLADIYESSSSPCNGTAGRPVPIGGICFWMKLGRPLAIVLRMPGCHFHWNRMGVVGCNGWVSSTISASLPSYAGTALVIPLLLTFSDHISSYRPNWYLSMGPQAMLWRMPSFHFSWDEWSSWGYRDAWVRQS